jgi:hypothetical protein
MTQPIKPINPGTLHKLIVKAEAPKPEEILQIRKSDYDKFCNDWETMVGDLEHGRAENKALKFRSWVNVGISAALSGALCFGTYWFTSLHYENEVNKAKLQGLKTASELLELKTRADAIFAKPVVSETKKPAVAYEAPKSAEKPLENIAAPKAPEKPLENLVSVSYRGLEYKVPKNEAEAYDAIKKYNPDVFFKENHTANINFGNDRLENLPQEILQFSSLERLDLSYNKIHSIKGLDVLKKLKYLNITSTLVDYDSPETKAVLESLRAQGAELKR